MNEENNIFVIQDIRLYIEQELTQHIPIFSSNQEDILILLRVNVTFIYGRMTFSLEALFHSITFFNPLNRIYHGSNCQLISRISVVFSAIRFSERRQKAESRASHLGVD